jgi:hypothetical protein
MENKKHKALDFFKDEKMAAELDAFNAFLNENPPKDWIKTLTFYNYQYLPIDKIEQLLRKIFRIFSYEILESGTVRGLDKVVIRVHYYHPILQKMMFTDGVGVKAPQMSLSVEDEGSYGWAKSNAVRNACLVFGKKFGADLNREDSIDFISDASMAKKVQEREEVKRIKILIEKAESVQKLITLLPQVEKYGVRDLYNKKMVGFKMQ